MNAFESEAKSWRTRPRIGITPESPERDGDIRLPAAYAAAVVRAGGLPLILPVWEIAAASLLACVDGVILAGGGDLDPACYGGTSRSEVYNIDAERDQTEIALARMALSTRVPLLGICRGAQVINVALGGTLIEHISGDEYFVQHRGDPSGYVPHSVTICPETRLEGILATHTCTPLSWHHQAIRIVAPGLTVAAVSPDGIIEAVEVHDQDVHPWFVGVQWHPEMSAAVDPVQQRLFDAFVDAARNGLLQPAEYNRISTRVAAG